MTDSFPVAYESNRLRMQENKWWRHRWTDGLSRALGCINSAEARKSDSYLERNKLLLEGLHELWNDLFDFQNQLIASGSCASSAGFAEELLAEPGLDLAVGLSAQPFGIFSAAFADQWLKKQVVILENLDEHEQCHFYEIQREMVELFFDRPSTIRLAMYGTLRRGQINHHIVSGIEGVWCIGSMSGSVMQYEGYPVFTWNPSGESIAVEVLESDSLQIEFARIDEFEGKNYMRILVPVLIDAENESIYSVASTYAFRNQFQSLE